MTTLTKMIMAVGVLLILFLHPVTRRIMFVILPLGRSWDDIIFWILFTALIILAFVKGWIGLPTKFKNFINKIEREETS